MAGDMVWQSFLSYVCLQIGGPELVCFIQYHLFIEPHYEVGLN